MEAQENDLSNVAAALADILKWSAELPAWQHDALRRLCGQIKLDAADITALVGISKGDAAGVPLDPSHVRDPAASHAVVSLGALYGLSHVNALAPGERLSFGKSGLTVIYGDNGAGKSGYGRLGPASHTRVERALCPRENHRGRRPEAVVRVHGGTAAPSPGDACA